MDRRHMLIGSLAAPLFAQAETPPIAREFYELRWFHLRNGDDAPRMIELLQKHWIPAAARVGLGPIGVLQPTIGADSPSVLLISAYATPAAAASSFETLRADRDFTAAYDRANLPRPAFDRMEATLLRAFSGMPRMQMPAAGGSHIFELRTYESNSMTSLAKKLEMFDGGEIAVFQRLGMSPVFFGEALFGGDLPKLTYMLAFENLAAREKLWGQFVVDPGFQKLRSQPGYGDGEIVSNISNTILHPLPFSAIR